MIPGKKWLAVGLALSAWQALAQETSPAAVSLGPEGGRPMEIVHGARLKPGTLMAAQPMQPAPRLEPALPAAAETTPSWQPTELGLAVLAVVVFVGKRLRR